ncbi:conserved Plasmodium protein, unknown function [Plasmodium berghei]|uniref:Uncharacterized protein n=1 Tax=Plasmodium berghei TaxID=5821 RepID=A0A0Y9WBA1_PLABE|nr:conserved Plasmodium protein, unknown function [Plasmodium berghei]SCO59942.1 conserved Plasmodium protein, unknown function [Plasmodium berghei]
MYIYLYIYLLIYVYITLRHVYTRKLYLVDCVYVPSLKQKKMNRQGKYDIFPPPLEKINNNNNNNNNKTEVPKTCPERKKKYIKTENTEYPFLVNDERSNIKHQSENKCFNKNDMVNINEKINKADPNILNKYNNLILNTNEINLIINDNANFKELLSNKQVSNFMNEYLATPLEAIAKYKNDKTVINFLEILFKYMNAKQKHIHLNNISETFTFGMK